MERLPAERQERIRPSTEEPEEITAAAIERARQSWRESVPEEMRGLLDAQNDDG
jgi:hypothetical protein